jgi:COMPASS component SWD2
LTDTFLSAGDDGTVRMYDLRHPNPKALLKDMGGSCLAAFDNAGQVFAVACGETRSIALYATDNPDGVGHL